MGFEEEFNAYKQTQQQKQAFEYEEAFRAYKKDQAQGGSIRQAPREAPFSVGGLLGGVAVGAATGNPAAAVVGAAGGEAIQQLVEHAVGSPTAPQTTGEAAQRITQEGAAMGIGEGLGRGMIFLADKLGRPLVGHMRPEAVAAEQFFAGKTAEPVLLPAEATDTRILDVLHNVAEYSVLGGGAIKKFKTDRDAFFNQLADDVVGRYGRNMTDIEIGRSVVDSVKRNFETARMPAQMIYNAIERQTAPEYIDVPVKMSVKRTETPVTKQVVKRETVKKQEGTTQVQSEESDLVEEPMLQGLRVKTTFQDIQVGERLEHLKVMTTMQERQISGAKIDLTPMKEELADIAKVAGQAGGLADREMGTTLMSFIQGKPDLVSYPVAKAIRTEVRTLSDALKASPETKNAPAIGKAKLVYQKLTDRIRAGLNEDDPFLADMWDEANRIEAGAQQTFNNKLVRSLIKEADARGGDAPGAIASSVWNASKDSVTPITRVRAAVDASDWQKMQRWMLDDTMTRAMDKGVIQGDKLEKLLFGQEGFGTEALKAGFDQATVTELRVLTNALKVAQAKQAEGTGRILIQMAQGGALMNLGVNILGELGALDYDPELKTYLASGIVVLGPHALAKVMTHPMGIYWLTQGFSTQAKGKEAVALAGRILSAAFPRPDLIQEPSVDPVRPSTMMTPQPLQQ